MFILRIVGATVFAIALVTTPALAQKNYDTGDTDTEIKIGNLGPYTGLFSEYGAEEHAEAAYFQLINDHGGISGRKINFVTVDDGSDVHKRSHQR